ncbi:3-deoxy-7-phosphoheptulonate synthase [Colwellia psychrerythraea]|uniref:Phospho-2-dehydro-3-deoxyheptonate aldolase n=1 Tax=Colwellia psychrerythraea TaxID=28229 RepID=A0A099KJE3_COLPS|nr:3-deoxy-7-phosphoheptulonate synthase [Colwellia psychrerythraea]KGJ90375.1 phospho-2-dehydro-3-deoxyheptonate aldolase [Colwellia psychrerythraea]
MTTASELSAVPTSSNNIHVNAEHVLITPEALRAEMPLSEEGREFVQQSRKTISDIIHKRDPRLLVISGPCSVHDVEAAKDYARQLKVLHNKYQGSLFVVMRVYFEKPRTTVGWKGLINDPHMDGSFDVETGLRKARELILYLTELGLPLATEALDPISPQYLAEVFSWSAIGARTTESQTHREMASGLSMPIGFKNGTNGSLSVAVNALQSAASPHHFMGINRQGQVALIQTSGNPDGHVILRGGTAPNYDAKSIAECEQALAKQGIDPGIIVDCSHGNSSKDYTRQPVVTQDIVEQICAGNKSIIGIMLESNINAGNQSSDLAKEELAYGVSVTDACIDFAETEKLLDDANARLSGCLTSRSA